MDAEIDPSNRCSRAGAPMGDLPVRAPPPKELRQFPPHPLGNSLAFPGDLANPSDDSRGGVPAAPRRLPPAMPPIAGVQNDIDRAAREDRAAKLARLYAALSQVSEAIVRADDPQALFTAVCRIVADTGRYALAWIGQVDGNRVVPAAAFGPAADYAKEIVVEVHGPFGNGPTGTCIRENHAVLNDNFLSNPSTAVWHEPARRYGIFASAAFPICREGRPIGAMTVYAADTESLDPEHFGLIESMAANLSYALDALADKQALRASVERLRLAQDAANCGTWEWNVATGQNVWADEVWPIYGLEPNTVTPSYEAWLEAVHPDDRQEAARIVAEAAANGADINVEWRVANSNAGDRWLMSRGRPVLDAAGRPQKYLGIVIDITQRKRAEERTRLLSDITAQLLASDKPQWIAETLCRRVMEHIGCDAFFNFLVDEHSGRLHLNACAGVSDEIARQIEWLDYGVAVCGCVAKEGCRIVAEDIQNSDDARADLVRSLGIQAYACHPLMDRDRVVGTLSFGARTKPAFAADELDLMKSVADHVAIAMQRVHLLESLERHAREAEAANAAKSQFLANMSHELRTPMNAILGMIDLTLPKIVDPAVKNCLKTAKESADLLLTLLNDLLDSAKIESGKLELESAPFSLRRMLAQVASIVSVRASEKGLAFHCTVPDDTPDALVGDRMRLQQVLLNLAGNAVKFTERGQVELGLRALCEDGVATLAFAVQDTGIGISVADKQRLFEPFMQADPTMVRRFGGTGLGLSISKSLVELMGGRISVESQLGVGSAFSFVVRFPLALQAPAELDVDTPPPPPSRRLRVLLAEDNPANQIFALHVLQERGHAVDIACDGHQAVALAADNRYDAILMDVQMPGVSGLEATVAIRKSRGPKSRDGQIPPDRPNGRHSNSFASASDVPIIAMTAHAMADDRRRCLAGGMDAYLSKPIKARQMIALVEAMASGLAPPEAATVPESGKMPQSDWRSGDAFAAVASPVRPIFDPALALDRCLNRPALLAEMINYFLSDYAGILSEIRENLARNDLPEVGRLAHRLKGTIGHLAAEPAKEAAERLERAGLFGATRDQVVEALDSFERECSALKAILVKRTASATRHG